MASITWNDITNGEDGGSVRTKINNFSNSVTTNVNNADISIANNASNISSLDSRVTINESDITTNIIDVSNLDVRVTFLEDQQLINVTTDYNVGNITNIILVDATAGNVIITLPSSSTINKTLKIKRVDSSVNTVTISSLDLIDTVNSVSLNSMESLTVISNQLQYYII